VFDCVVVGQINESRRLVVVSPRVFDQFAVFLTSGFGSESIYYVFWYSSKVASHEKFSCGVFPVARRVV
jgi:hypothetical protein